MESDYTLILNKYEAENRLRKIPADRTESPVLDMVSNDYLGLATRYREFIPEFHNRFPDAEFSSSASRLLSQRQDTYLALEHLLGDLYRKSVLLLNSGYHANVGITQALNIPDTVFLPDKLVHASMIDGLSLAGAEFRRWRHNDIESLRKLLQKYSDKSRCVVMVESVYSMDGDCAPLKEITALKREFPNLLIYLDEAHGFGCFGDRGLGLAEELDLLPEIDLLMGTMGKAAASSGAFVAASPTIKDFLINTARSFIFSTAIPPVNVAWSILMVEKILEMKKERNHLRFLSKYFKQKIEEITGIPNPSESQIVPLITGDAGLAVELSYYLSRNHIDALAIRRPTVPPGGERIRFSLSADMTQEEIDKVVEIINGFPNK